MLTCASCGRENPADARFCNACGTPLGQAPSRRQEVRKLVTVLFTDITGSTALGERLDPESIRRLMTRYFADLTEVIERHGGTVEKFIGDAVMAVFGIPQAHEDDALRAVRAAVDMRAPLAALNEEVESRHSVAIQVRTGINTGEVVAGDSSTRQSLVTGDTVNVAARLEQSAAPGEILIGPETHALVRDAVTVEPLEPLTLKGKAERLPAFRLIGVTPGASGHERRLDAPMVGRDPQLLLLREAFEAAVSHRTCHLVTVLGQAGVGKSRLVEEFVRGAARDATLLRGRCLSYGEGITFWPIGEAVVQAAGIDPADAGEEVRKKIAALLGEGPKGTAVAERVAGVTGLADGAFAPEDTFWAIRKFLEAVARSRPLVLVLDDLHWAEPTLLDVVDHLAEWTRDASLLLLCMARPELLDERPGWDGGRRNVSSILLEPLTDEDSGRLMSHLLGGAELAPEAKARVVESAEGNPLFVEEMVSMLIDDGLLRRSNGHWVATSDLSGVGVPTSIKALLIARLDRLGREERLVIERASVEGKAFHRGAVVSLCGPEIESLVDDHLSTLARKELIGPETSLFAGDTAFTFRHILIREAAYEAMPKEIRGDLHLRFADWLVEAAAGRLAEYEEIVASHLERAIGYRMELGVADEETARIAASTLRHLESATERASARGDRWATAKLIDRRLALLPAADPSRIGLMVELAGLLPWLGDLVRAESLLDEALAAARSSGDRLAEGRVLLERLDLAWLQGSEDAGEARKIEVERLLPIFEVGDDSLGMARAWMTLGSADSIACRFDQAIEAYKRCGKEAERAGSAGEELARRSRQLILECAWLGSTSRAEGIGLCRAAIDRPGGDLTDRASGLEVLGCLLAMSGDFGAARASRDESRLIYQDLGLWFDLAVGHESAGFIEQLAGDLMTAELEFRRGFEMLMERGDHAHASTMLLELAFALIRQGRLEEAQGCVSRCEELSPTDDVSDLGLVASAKARILSGRRADSDAVAEAQRGVDIFEHTEQPNALADALITLSVVVLQAGDRSHASSAAARALGLYEMKGNLVSAASTRSLIDRIAADP